MWLFILSCTVLFYLFVYCKQKFNFGKHDKLIAGPPAIPILGNALEFIGIGPEGKYWNFVLFKNHFFIVGKICLYYDTISQLRVKRMSIVEFVKVSTQN